MASLTYSIPTTEELDASMEAMRRVYMTLLEALDYAVKRETPVVQQQIASSVKVLRDGLESGLKTTEATISQFKTIETLQNQLGIPDQPKK